VEIASDQGSTWMFRLIDPSNLVDLIELIEREWDMIPAQYGTDRDQVAYFLFF